jgi:hypothetical protein
MRRLGVMLFLHATPCAADFPEERHRVLPCRPTISCTADLVPPGSFEIEAGYYARRVPPAGYVHDQPLLAKLTLFPWIQAQLGMNGAVFTTGRVSRSARYLDDITFGAKIHFLDQHGWLPSMAVSASLSVPSWEPRTDFPWALDASFWAYLSKDVGRFHFDLNGGVNLWELDVLPRWQPFVSLASGYSFTKEWGALLETYVFATGGRITPEDGGVLSGLTYAPRPWIMLDAGIDVGFFQMIREYGFFLGLTTVLYDFWDTEAELHPVIPPGK